MVDGNYWKNFQLEQPLLLECHSLQKFTAVNCTDITITSCILKVRALLFIVWKKAKKIKNETKKFEDKDDNKKNLDPVYEQLLLL